jgi:CheY-like chemotaxis protein
MSKLVLIADDNSDNISLVRTILKRSGLDVEIAEVQNGRAVLEFTTTKVPDIILLDMKMPVMDGYETATALRSDGKTKSIPIVAVTAQAMVGDKERAISAGCNEYLTKPIDRTALINAVKKYLPKGNSSGQD